MLGDRGGGSIAGEKGMSTTETTHSEAEIARVAHQIWEDEGRPEGRDREHWRQACERLGVQADPAHAPRPVQPGFEDAAPGMVPRAKEELAPGELSEEPGGRFAQQLADAPDSAESPPRNPAPIPPAGPEGYVAVPSRDDVAPGTVSDDPAPPRRPGKRR